MARMNRDRARTKLLNIMPLAKLQELACIDQPRTKTRSQLVNRVHWTDETHAEIKEELDKLLRIAQ